MFWIVFWIASLLFFLLVPILCVPENRRRWYRRLTGCRWNVADEEVLPATTTANERARAGGPNANGEENAYHYVLSRAQEDEIRSSFLSERLRLYTKTLTAAMMNEADGGVNKAVATVDRVVEPDDDAEIPSAAVVVAGSSSVDVVDPEAATTTATTKSPESNNPEGSSSTHTDELSSSFSNNGDGRPAAVLAANANDDEEEDDNHYASSSDDEYLPSDGMDEFMGEATTMIVVPLAGRCSDDTTPDKDEDEDENHAIQQTSKHDVCSRQVPNGCAICLSTIDVDDTLTWSSNPQCNHVFHNECILEWLEASGRKHLKRQRRQEQRNPNATVAYANDPLARILKFPMLCPCCRQTFVIVDEDVDDHDLEKQQQEQPPPPQEQPAARSEGPISMGPRNTGSLTTTASTDSAALTTVSSGGAEEEEDPIDVELPTIPV